jgi:hypothetical protein
MKVVSVVGVLALGALAGCSGGVATVSTAAPTHEGAVAAVRLAADRSPLSAQVLRWRQLARERQPDAKPECTGSGTTHFDTPEAAMRYLAKAWNVNDLEALCAVTNPNARMLLLRAHREAVNLRLAKCRPSMDGMYSCTFRHDFPRRTQPRHSGRMWVDVAPAINPGYYMTVFVGCGG